MKPTRGGVYLDVAQSEYITEACGIQFKFSSLFYLNRFERKLNEYISILSSKIYNLCGMMPDISKIAAVWCYSECERRGFCIQLENGQVCMDKGDIDWFMMSLN